MKVQWDHPARQYTAGGGVKVLGFIYDAVKSYVTAGMPVEEFVWRHLSLLVKCLNPASASGISPVSLVTI